MSYDLPMPKGHVLFDGLLFHYGFKAGEIERRAFLDRHHHLINPRLYPPGERARRNHIIFVQAFARASATNQGAT